MATGVPTATNMSMTDALYKLAAWLSPSYPVGAFSYSHGLETAVRSGQVSDATALSEWISDCIRHGAGRTDTILLAAAYRDPNDEAIAELAGALQPSRERYLESTAQGAAFMKTTASAWGDVPDIALPYSVAVGRAAAAHHLPLADTIVMFLHAFAANLVSAGIRTIPIGQTDGQKVLAAMMPVCRTTSEEAMSATLDDLGSSAIMADIASTQHETLAPRLFRS